MEQRIYQRDKLYEEVWAEPMIKVAGRYGVSDVALKKTCKKLDVPVPGRGYWAKIKAGQKIKKTPLGKHKGNDKIVVMAPTPDKSEMKIMKTDLLSFMPEEQRDAILSYCKTLIIPTTLEKPHSMIRATLQYKRSRKDSTRPPINQVLNFKNSEGTQERVFLFVDTLFKALERFGYVIENRTPKRERYYKYQPRVGDIVTFIKKDEDAVPIQIKERMRQIPHVPTEQEIKDNRRYPDLYPLKDTELAYSGELIFSIDCYFIGRKNWNDSEKFKIENKIAEIIIHIMQAIQETKELRIQKEIEDRKSEEEQKRLEQLREKQYEEFLSIRQLLNDSENYQAAQKIYQYIEAIKSEFDIEDEQVGNYIKWVKDKADWINPIIRKKDDLMDELDTNIKDFILNEDKFKRRRYW